MKKNAISKEKIFAFLKKHELTAFLLIVSALAVFLRASNFEFESNDYRTFLSAWYVALQEAGGFEGIGTVYGDYTPLYMYVLAFMTYLPLSDLYSIKIFSCIFDFILAVYVGLIVRRLRGTDLSFCIGYTLTLILPNVFLNSAVWAQCDGVFTAFIVMSLYYIMQGKDIPAMILYGFAWSFKLQSVFFLPVVILAALKKKIRWQSLFLVAGVYFLCGLPAVFAGMSFGDAYGVYFNQMGEYSSLTMNTPNLYNWVTGLTEVDLDGFGKGAVAIAVCAVAIAMLPLYRKQYRTDDDRLWLTMAAFFAAMMPFVMPHMHERYWYLSDIFALCLLLVEPKKWYVSAAVILPSLYVVCSYLFGLNIVERGLLALVMLAGIVGIGKELYRSLKQNELPVTN
jgi:Gpi18-like mannosyltransferase